MVTLHPHILGHLPCLTQYLGVRRVCIVAHLGVKINPLPREIGENHPFGEAMAGRWPECGGQGLAWMVGFWRKYVFSARRMYIH
ncbi:hypothetical protein D6833_09920 [Candidatus Parcubacteria bacterium]|nr:MAG: hypothetical protein D6833_09920 [Candidatus Parcubacteria bacterium]